MSVFGIKKTVKNRIAIVGSGIIGSALAFELSRRNISDVHVFDADIEGSLSSTERNAGGIRHLWLQAINSELSRVSIQFFESIRNEIGFIQNGYLWLRSQTTASQGDTALKLARERGLEYERVSPHDIKDRYPFLDKLDDVAFGIFGRRDGILNSNSLKSYFQKKSRDLGVRFYDRHLICAIKEDSKGCHLSLLKLNNSEAQSMLERPVQAKSSGVMAFDQVVFCCGAWTSQLLKGSQIESITKPVRRQIAFFQTEGLDLSPYGMIVDTSGVYFHAEGGNCLAGLVIPHEPEGFNFSYDPDFFTNNIWPALYHRSSKMERLKHVSGWGGLYAYTPDVTGILGLIPGFKSVYESHGYTGHGVMHSYGAAVAMSDLLITGKFSEIDARCLSRERFKNGQLLTEGLHI